MAGQSEVQAITTAEIGRLNWRLGLAYAEAVQATIAATKIKPALIGCHGQTIYHQGVPAPYAGRRIACTWQLGEPALIAAATGLPVVSNFRPADMAAGGQGAPLVPLLDFVLFAHPTRARVLQNIGGIGNLTVIPAGAAQDNVIAFDTGPGNMIIDALMQQLFQKPYDRDGRIAATGKILASVIDVALKEKFFRQPPPKSAGREQYGELYAARFLEACRKHSPPKNFRPEDAVATATAFTVATIADAIERWVLPLTDPTRSIDYIVSGGGARNATLLGQLRERLPGNATLSTIDQQGLPAQAKEAAAFALLAWQTWNHQPGNIPSATGAKRPAILGSITYA
jgi:anhydro-N-acetylmuramic acid kinase